MADTTVAEGTKDSRERLHGLSDKVADSIEAAESRFQKVANELHDKYEKATHKLHDAYDKVADTSMNDVCNSVGGYVKRNPGQSMLMAAGAGLLLGYLMGRRR